MHIVKDENGNLCPHADGHAHTHEHTHADGQVHTHEHTHADGRTHEHTHGHDTECSSDCSGGCHGCGEHDPKKENIALLTYMLQHNEHHAAELDQMSEKLRMSGQEAAAEQIRKAVDEFQKGNLYLRVALTTVKES